MGCWEKLQEEVCGNAVTSHTHRERNLVASVLLCLVFTTEAARTTTHSDKLRQPRRPTHPVPDARGVLKPKGQAEGPRGQNT